MCDDCMACVGRQVGQWADQLSTEHDTASDEGPAAYTVGHASHHLQQQPAQAYNGYAEEGPPHGLGCHKPGAPPAHAHRSFRAASHAYMLSLGMV